MCLKISIKEQMFRKIYYIETLQQCIYVITSVLVEHWLLLQTLQVYLLIQNTDVLVYDGYWSHLSLRVLKLFDANNIVVYALPAHRSGTTQLCDLVVFSCFKKALNSVANNCVSGYTCTKIRVFDFSAMMKEAYERSFTISNIKACFRRAGLWPFNANKLLSIPCPVSESQIGTIALPEQLENEFE